MSTATHTGTDLDGLASGPPTEHLALAIAWAPHAPERVGEVALVPADGRVRVLGRGHGSPEDPGPRLIWLQQRPGESRAMAPLSAAGLSRLQLEVRAAGGALHLTHRGRAPLRVDGHTLTEATAGPGSVIGIGNQLILLCILRPPTLPAARWWPADQIPAFGQADPFGAVGESPPAWAARDTLAFVGARDGHALILGPSGVGKEICARTVHALSGRARRPLVARNAATLPAGLIDAELFGHARDYPHAGMPARIGLIGEAEGGTLFLDELGELPEAQQAHLLRVLDGGEYHRLGETGARRAHVRLLAATNRPVQALKADLAARLKLRISVTGLESRREDIPLLVQALLAQGAASDPRLRGHFFTPEGRPRVAAALMEALLRHTYTLHARELDGLLWQSMAESPDDHLALTPGVAERLVLPVAEDTTDPTAIDAATLQAALDACGGNQSAAFQYLGLRSRHQLIRLMRKHGLAR